MHYHVTTLGKFFTHVTQVTAGMMESRPYLASQLETMACYNIVILTYLLLLT